MDYSFLTGRLVDERSRSAENRIGSPLFVQRFSLSIAVALLALATSASRGQGGYVVGWGDNSFGQTSVPPGLTNIVAVAAGARHSMALRSDGTVVVWGDGSAGQTNIPPGLSNVVAIAAGADQCLALKADGTVAAWPGFSFFSPSGAQSITNAGLSNVIAIAQSSQESTALMTGGNVYRLGNQGFGQSPGGGHTWGNLIGISEGDSFGLGLRDDGTLVGWFTDVPADIWFTDVPGNITNAVAVSAGDNYALVLKQDGTVAARGDNSRNQTNIPPGLSNVVAVAAGGNQCLALKSDGYLVSWGTNAPIQGFDPAQLSNVVAIAVGTNHGLALVGNGGPAIIGKPSNLAFNYEAPATLAIAAVGAPPLSYQWFFQGAPIPAATNFSLVIPSVYSSDIGDYFVSVSNRLGQANSSVLTLASPNLSTFRNLDFEAPALMGWIEYYGPFPASRGFPGWTAYLGTNELTEAIWDCAESATRCRQLARLEIDDAYHGFWPGGHGNWTAILGGGLPVTLFSGGTATIGIAQYGAVSSIAKSLHFRASNAAGISISFAGQLLPPATLVSGQEYATDVSGLAGAFGELRFTSSSPSYLDDIFFSAEPVSGWAQNRPALSVTSGGGGIEVSFSALVGTNYALEASTNLSNWQAIATLRATNTPVKMTVPGSPGSSNTARFYRLMVGP